MPLTFSVNENNDIYVDSQGNLAVSVGVEAIMQNAEHAIKTLLGEMIYQTNEGVPDFSIIWDGTPNIPQFENAIFQTLSTVEGVIRVVNVTAEIDNLEGSVNYVAIIITQFSPSLNTLIGNFEGKNKG